MNLDIAAARNAIGLASKGFGLGTPRRLEHSPSRTRPTAPRGTTALVIGGGLAGLAAATALAERGVRTTLIERDPVLGGRLASWPIELPDGTTVTMERGFHAFFRQYYNIRALMRRWDPNLERLIKLADYPILGPEGALLRFDDLPRQTPFNVAAVALRGRKWLSPMDLLKVDVKRALAMVSAKTERDLERWDHMTARAYLDGLNFPPAARRMLFDVFAHSFFNPEDEMSAAELLSMFRFYFTGNPEGLVFDVLDDPFGPAFIDLWSDYLRSLGVTIMTATAGMSVNRCTHGFAVTTSKGIHEADLVVLALEVEGLVKLAKDSDALDARDLEVLSVLTPTAPFAVHRYWLDRQPRPDRDPFAGTTGLGRLDNISIFERIEGESRRWSERTGGSVVELHAYGLATPFDEGELKAELWRGLIACYPELEGARVIHEEWLLRADCPSFPVGSLGKRPTVETMTPGLALAGDFVRLPFPSALMERAVTSGLMAANHLLAPWHVREEAIYHL
jgi:isorenieratene synthase